MHEGQGAAASGIAGIGLQGLPWGLDKMGIVVPYSVAVMITIASILLILAFVSSLGPSILEMAHD